MAHGTSTGGFFELLQKQLLSGSTFEAVFRDSTHYKVASRPTTREGQKVGLLGGLNKEIRLVAGTCGGLTSLIHVAPCNVSDHTAAPELTADLNNTAFPGGCRRTA